MIAEITVENLAIIEQTQISLGPGFTVLTGETGAGKSLLVDAIELALGERADADLVRAGAARAAVSLVVDLSDQAELRTKCSELGIPLEDNLLYIQREVMSEGRSQCRVAGRLTPVSGLRQIGQLLVDLHGQHDHQSLLHAERHLGFLDSWIGALIDEPLGAVMGCFDEVESLKRRLSAIRSGMRDREQRIDLLSYQIKEIEAVDPQPGELAALENELSRLQHAEKLSAAARSALEATNESEASATVLLGGAIRSLDEAAKLDAILETILEPMRNAFFSLEDAVRALGRYAEGIESNPQALEAAAARIDALKRLRRKYGEDEEAVRAFLDTARGELDLLADAEANETGTEEALHAAESRLAGACDGLTSLRRERAREFASLVEIELGELAMEKARFEVAVESKPVDATGADRVEFYFCANAGEPLRPLARIASGGEISRVMLAIKTVMASRADVPTLIFDEVDAGLGGRVAAVVARKLEQLAQHFQVLVISHLPQIASRASAHYRIEKTEQGGRVRTEVRPLFGEERIDEIGRMLSGDVLSEAARRAAKELLQC